MDDRGQRYNRAGRGGFTLLEVTVAIGVLMLALLGFSRSISGAVRDQASQGERMRALNAARAAIEGLRARPFASVYVLHNDDGDDDPGGAGTAPGPHCAVPGLAAPAGDLDGAAGRILFPEIDSGSGPVLREDLVDPVFGLPFDLDADGVIDGGDKSSSYRLLPVLVRISWLGGAGSQELELATWLCN
jgi:hypothetical protein